VVHLTSFVGRHASVVDGTDSNSEQCGTDSGDTAVIDIDPRWTAVAKPSGCAATISSSGISKFRE